MGTGGAHRAVGFHLAVRVRVALRAVVFHLAVRAGGAVRAEAYQLAVRARVAVRAVLFHLAVGAGVALRAGPFPLAVRARVARHAVPFPLAVRARVAVRAGVFLPSMRAPFTVSHHAPPCAFGSALRRHDGRRQESSFEVQFRFVRSEKNQKEIHFEPVRRGSARGGNGVTTGDSANDAG